MMMDDDDDDEKHKGRGSYCFQKFKGRGSYCFKQRKARGSHFLKKRQLQFPRLPSNTYTYDLLSGASFLAAPGEHLILWKSQSLGALGAEFRRYLGYPTISMRVYMDKVAACVLLVFV